MNIFMAVAGGYVLQLLKEFLTAINSGCCEYILGGLSCFRTFLASSSIRGPNNPLCKRLAFNLPSPCLVVLVNSKLRFFRLVRFFDLRSLTPGELSEPLGMGRSSLLATRSSDLNARHNALKLGNLRLMEGKGVVKLREVQFVP